MHMYLKALEKVASRYAPSRVLSFDVVHVFAALLIVDKHGKASRRAFSDDLALGEGTVKTLVKHLKMQGLILTSNSGTKLTPRGRQLCSGLLSSIPVEMALPRCSVALGKFNYAVLVKEFGFAIKSGIEQRDAAIRMGATGATTLIFRENKFVMPMSMQDSLKKESQVRKMIVDKLNPREDDVIIIGSADKNEKTAELAAKNAALLTIFGHEKHHHR